MRRLLSLTLSLALTHSAFASIATYDLLPEGSSSSILVRNGTSVIESHNAEQLMPPASTLKVVTALAAKLQWPNNEFRFSTELLKQDQDYVVRFSGDPSLLRKDLEALLRPLKGKTISGDLILDDSIFTGYTEVWAGHGTYLGLLCCSG
ncbi:D-alanyl-D-alanine carboxypeptidase [Vibrio sp. JCM 19236]|nr:D-alanyl-D-alanine carboxypeptidase [Vibrio sp. JCM 19236]